VRVRRRRVRAEPCHDDRSIAGNDSATVEAFVDRGWGWGGDWSSSRDHQHLSSTGR
jgi:hypothetical protein